MRLPLGNDGCTYFNKLMSASHHLGNFQENSIFSFSPLHTTFFSHNHTLINLKNESVALHPHDAVLLTLTYLSHSPSRHKTYHMTDSFLRRCTQITLWSVIFPSSLTQPTSSCVLFEHENLILKIANVYFVAFIMTKKHDLGFVAFL